jgi:hypothetical protein
MQRTTTRRRREFQRFITRNRRLFPLAGLFLVGVAGGVAVYTAADGRIPAALMTLSPVPAGGWWQALGSSCFSSVLWLGALVLLGLWGCGAPFILAVPLIHGWGLGLTEAYYYSHGWGGVAIAAAAVMPVGLLTAGVLIAAGVQSLRMSVDICHRLLGDQQSVACRAMLACGLARFGASRCYSRVRDLGVPLGRNLRCR